MSEAAICWVVLKFGRLNPATADGVTLLLTMNFALALFNMLPVPPLDGSRIVDAMMPARWRPAWNAFAPYGMAIVLVLLLGPLLWSGINLVEALGAKLR